jgi:Zn-dependent peptidase ImmA (M78 family)
MPHVRVSAERFRSLLTNRHLSADDVADRVAANVRPHDLLVEDMDVEFEDLEKLAKLFSRPWSYLLIDAAEVYPDAGSDNRTFANRRVQFSPELLAELQAADLMLETASDLFSLDGYRAPNVPVSGVPAAELSADIRAILGVSVDDQLAAKDEYAALRLWVSAIHALGVYVSQRGLADPTVRAFSKTRGGQALIVVSTKDDPYPRIFSAIHEYCHVTLRSTGICDLLDHSSVERYCNEVTAGVLLPAEALERVLTPGAFTGDQEALDVTLKSLSGQLHVSQQALLIALRDRQKISQELYDGMEARRAARRKGGKKKPGGDYYRTAINRVGRLYAHRVIDAVGEGAIDRQDASALLGVGEHSVGTFVRELAKAD